MEAVSLNFHDSDLNPQTDKQAMDRPHRIVRAKKVRFQRLISKGTILRDSKKKTQLKKEKKKLKLGLSDRLLLLSNSLQPSSNSLLPPVVTAADDGAVASFSTGIKRKIRDDDDEYFPALPQTKKNKIISNIRVARKLVRLTYELLKDAGLVDDPMGCPQDEAADKFKLLSILESSPTPL